MVYVLKRSSLPRQKTCNYCRKVFIATPETLFFHDNKKCKSQYDHIKGGVYYANNS